MHLVGTVKEIHRISITKITQLMMFIKVSVYLENQIC